MRPRKSSTPLYALRKIAKDYQYVIRLDGEKSGTVILAGSRALYKVGKWSLTWNLGYFDLLTKRQLLAKGFAIP